MKNNIILVSIILSSGLFGCQKNNEKINPPIPPTTLNANTKSTSQIDLSWTDNSTNEDGFKVERKIGTEAYKEIATINKDITTFSDQGLTKATAYTYRVYAYNNGGKSVTYTNEATATTQDDVPTAASNLTAESVAFNRVNLTWSDNATNETGYKIERKTGIGAYSELISLAANTVQYKDETVSENVEYTYRVFPIKSSVNGAYSNEAKTKTPFDLVTGLVAYYPFTGNAGDSSGNGNHGIVSGAIPVSDRFNKPNSSYYFSKNLSSYIIPPNLNKTLLNTFTIGFWVNPELNLSLPMIGSNFGQAAPCVIHPIHGQNFGDYNSNYGVGIYVGNNGIYVNEHTHTIVKNVLAFSKNLLGWHYIILVYDNKLPKLYVDGILSTTGISNDFNVYASLGPDKNTLADYSHSGFGSGFNDTNNNGNNFFQGYIDDIRYYNRILTLEQIVYLATH